MNPPNELSFFLSPTTLNPPNYFSLAVAVSVVSPYEYGRFDLPNGKRGFIEENKLSKEEIQKIVDVHNDVRSKAGASNMFTMKWDSDLADLAQG